MPPNWPTGVPVNTVYTEGPLSWRLNASGAWDPLTGSGLFSWISASTPYGQSLAGLLGAAENRTLLGVPEWITSFSTLTTQRILGRRTAGAGAAEEVSLSQLLDWSSTTQGTLLYRGASGWVALAPPVVGSYLGHSGNVPDNVAWFADSEFAFVSGGLDQFESNSTTSANLQALLTDETGTGSVVFSNAPTLSGAKVSTSASVTAGTNAQGQGALTNDLNVVTMTAANPSGVTLPTATVGRRVTVVNRGTNPVAVFPAIGAQIDSVAVNTSITVPAGERVDLIASSVTQWQSDRLLAGSGGEVTLSGAQTLTNKTFGNYTETVFTITDAAAFEINPNNGPIQLITLGANRTPAATTFAAGQSVTLMIDDGTAFAITWTTVAVTWVGGTAPTLATTGRTVIELWKVASTIYGAWVGNVA